MIFGIKTVKFFLFVFNFIFAIFGIAMLALGVVYKLQIEPIVDYLGNDFPVAPDLFIAIGTVAFAISFLGCIGASRENRSILMAFVILLIILLVIELAVVVIAFVEITNGQLKENIEETLEHEKETGNLGKLESKVRSVENILICTVGNLLHLECCGVTGPFETYLNMTIPNNCFDDNKNFSSTECLDTITDILDSSDIPLTCFQDMEIKLENLYLEGCFDKIKDIFHRIGIQLGSIAIAISILEIVGTLFALTLTSIIRTN